MATTLLSTKLFIPPRRPRDSVVERSRLTQRLTEINGQRLTLISAPAGFGKTTLLSEWMPHSERCVPWLSLDANDNDPARFWSYVIAALQRLQPDLGTSALALLQSPQPPPIESVLTLLLNDVAVFSDRFVLVLDDYHLVETPAIHTALTFLLDHLPPQMHVVITSRSDPPLPLARWRVRRQLTEIRAADLRFTTAEAAAFLNRVMGLNLSAADIAALETRTEGWIAGLQLAALSMQGHGDAEGFIRSFTGSHAYIVDYLAEEVVQRQSSELQAFLLQTSILDRMCGPLCNAVLARTDSQATLETLQRSNLFVIPLDDERRWYRYHHLFAEVLRARLREAQPAAMPTLHRRASDWCEQNGLSVDAIQHAFAAESIELAVRLIEQHGLSLIARGELHVVLHWLGRLPADLFLTHPMLCIAHGAALALNYASQADHEPVAGYVFLSPQLGSRAHIDRPALAAPFATVDGSAFAANAMSGGATHGHDYAVKFNYPAEALAADPGLVAAITVNMSNALMPAAPDRQFAALAQPFGLWIGAEDELFLPDKVLAFANLAPRRPSAISTARPRSTASRSTSRHS